MWRHRGLCDFTVPAHREGPAPSEAAVGRQWVSDESLWVEGGDRERQESHSEEFGLHAGLSIGQGLANHGPNLYDQIARVVFMFLKSCSHQ